MLQWAEELSSVYANVEDVDFLVGCLAESPRPDGYIISETAFYVFIMNASRRLLCDRFYQVGDACIAWFTCVAKGKAPRELNKTC